MRKHTSKPAKGLFSLMLAAVTVCGTFTGCSTRAQVPTTAPAIRPTETTLPAASDPILEETVIFDREGITVTATGLRSGLFGPEIAVTIENNTDANVAVSSRSLSVNSYMLSASGLYNEVAAGKKALGSLNLLSSELEAAGIDTIANAEFFLSVYDTDTYEDIAESGLITLTTSAADHVQTIDDSGQLLLEEAGIRILSKGLRDDLVWDGCLLLYLENNSSDTLTVTAENVSVNGYMVTDGLYSELRPGTRSLEGLYLLDLEELGIDGISQIRELSLSLKATDENFREVLSSEPLELTFG